MNYRRPIVLPSGSLSRVILRGLSHDGAFPKLLYVGIGRTDSRLMDVLARLELCMGEAKNCSA